jgi:hypothetical protein
MAKHDYTVMGVKLSLDPRVISDVKTLKLFRQVLLVAQQPEGGEMKESDALNAFGIFDLLDRLVGADQSDYVLESLADEDGFTPTEKLGEFIGALFEAVAPKNSSGSQQSGHSILQNCEPISSNTTT